MKMPNSKLVRYVVPAVVSALLFYLLFSKIDIQNVLSNIRGCNIRLLLLAVLISLSINIMLGAAKWRKILAAMGCDLPYREVLSIRTGCIPFKIIFPMKSSELLKHYTWTNKTNYPLPVLSVPLCSIRH